MFIGNNFPHKFARPTDRRGRKMVFLFLSSFAFAYCSNIFLFCGLIKKIHAMNGRGDARDSWSTIGPIPILQNSSSMVTIIHPPQESMKQRESVHLSPENSSILFVKGERES